MTNPYTIQEMYIMHEMVHQAELDRQEQQEEAELLLVLDGSGTSVTLTEETT
jgi:hypothetical protein